MLGAGGAGRGAAEVYEHHRAFTRMPRRRFSGALRGFRVCCGKTPGCYRRALPTLRGGEHLSLVSAEAAGDDRPPDRRRLAVCHGEYQRVLKRE